MDFKSYKYLIYSDLFRITDNISKKVFLKELVINVGFRYTFLLRSIKFLRTKKLLKVLFYPIIRIIYRHNTYKYGIHISTLDIGSGFYIGHFGGIFINRNVVIGNNVNISQDVTIGGHNRGERKGFPIIGNNVYIAPGAKIFGKIIVGDNVAIGANSVITKDIPENAVVVGIPGEIQSYKGTKEYVINTNYKMYY